MKKLLKVTIWIVGIILGLLTIGFGVGYLATSGDYSVPQTVEFDDSLPRIEINNTVLHAETFGNDTSTLVVVLHGGPGQDYRYLLPLQALADEYHVVFYDQRGSGLSARVPAEELTLELFISDLKAVVDLFSNGKSVFLIGHSWGAMLASTYIGKYPETIQKAVLLEPGFLTPEMGNELMEKTNYFQPDMNLNTLIQVITLWFRSLHLDGPDDQEGMDFFMQELILNTEIENHPMAGYYCDRDLKNSYVPGWRMGTLASQTLQKSAMNDEGKIVISFIGGVENFKRKVLFISGSCNTLIGPEYQNRQMQYFPVREMVIIDNAGHTMVGEKPDETIEVIREYFSE